LCLQYSNALPLSLSLFILKKCKDTLDIMRIIIIMFISYIIMENRMSEKTYLLKLTEALHKQIKVQAAIEGETFNSLVIKAVEAYLKKKGGK
jgi:hypothetical protein